MLPLFVSSAIRPRKLSSSLLKHIAAVAFLAVFALPLTASAETFQYRYGSTTYGTLGEAEAAMRSAIGAGGSALRHCSSADGSGTSIALYYCAPHAPSIFWHNEFTVPGGSSPVCANSNDRLTNYCASEGELVTAYTATWEAANPTRCISNQYSSGEFVDPPVSSWAVNSYNPGTGTKRFVSLSHNNPVYGDRRKGVIEHKPCASPESSASTASFFINWAEHATCPAGYEPRSGVSFTWPRVCEGPTATITKLAAKTAATTPRSCAPCVPATGEKLVFEDDFEWAGVGFRRIYGSMRDEPAGANLDASWSHIWNESLRPATTTGSTARSWWKNSHGDIDEFRFVTSSTTQMYSVNTNSRRLSKQPSGWLLRDTDGIERHFDIAGKLVRVLQGGQPETAIEFGYLSGQLASATDARGRQIEFVQDGGRIVEVRIAGGATLVTYSYDAQDRLASATYPGGKSRSYLYAEPANMCIGAGGGCSAGLFPNRITGVIDETNVRVLDVTYDGNGRVVASTRPVGDKATSLSYSAGTLQREMTIAGSGRSDYLFESSAYRRPLSKSLYDGSTLIGTETWEYPTNKLSTRHTNLNGVATRQLFNSAGLQTELIEAERKGSNTSLPEKRTTETTWSTDSLPRPTQTEIRNATGSVVLREAIVYTSRGQVQSRALEDPASSITRVTSSAFCEAADVLDPLAYCPIEGLVKTVTAPGGAVTSLRYRTIDHAGCAVSPTSCEYRKGDLWQTVGPEGHVLEVLAYDGTGRPVSVLDPNGVRTDVAFNARGWLSSIAVRGASAPEDAVITLGWTDDGLLASATDADGVVLTRAYDAAGRLVAIEDALGNRQELTLGAGGNVIQETVKDGTAAVRRTISRVYDSISRLSTVADAFSNPTDFTYDANGNLKTLTDALGKVTSNTYDNRDRLVQTVQDVGGINATVALEYDVLDRVTKVTDPKGLHTTYAYNGFGELTQLSSPDTGTSAFTYDSAGNRASATDARGVVATYSHDGLGRVTAVDYSGGSAEDVAFTWDVAPGACTTGETHAIGRLGTMTDGSGSTAYCYDRRGNLVRKVQTTGGVTLQVRYGYSKADQLAWIVYPDGTRVDYGRNLVGDVSSVDVTRPGQPLQGLVDGVAYHPFGPPALISYASGRVQQRPLDAAGQPVSVQDTHADALTVDFGFNAVGNLTSLTQPAGSSPVDIAIDYDALGRLTAFRDAPTSVAVEAYSYDATGNRTSFTDLSGAQSYTYPGTSHRLSSVASTARTYDAAGNTLTAGDRSYSYNAAGRMATSSLSGSLAGTYAYTGAGEQVKRVAAGVATLFVYDEAGQLLGQYDSLGQPLQQYLRMDSLPVGVIAGGQLLHVQSDHLGTPRAVIDLTRNVPVWTWPIIGEAFGATVPNEDPDLDGTGFVFDLRFPGQRFDSASGLSQNYFRDYESLTGRYPTSDPIGLVGGLNTYAYVSQNPLLQIDPEGLQTRRAVPARPMTTAEVFARIEVPSLIRQIQQYEPTFRYQTVGPRGYRYNGQDSAFLRDILRQHQEKQNSSCSAPISYGITPGGIPLTRHYSTETGPGRNIPVSLIDTIVRRSNGVPSRGATKYYDAINDVTVVIGTNGVMSTHRGK